MKEQNSLRHQQHQPQDLQLDNAQDAQNLADAYISSADLGTEPPDSVQVLDLLARRAHMVLENSVVFNWSEYHKKQLGRLKASLQYQRLLLDFQALNQPATPGLLEERQRLENVITFIEQLIAHK